MKDETMSLQDRLTRNFGPGILAGVKFGDWWEILQANKFAVDARYLPRAAGITVLSLINSLTAALEERRFGATLREVKVPPPVFILGMWRSGTTHLHNLLTRDQRFGYPNLYEVLNPHTFLSGGDRGACRLDRFVSHRRAMDGMQQGAFEPVEEDIALAVCGMSSMLGLVFPRSLDRYWRWVIVERNRERWRAAYLRFVAALSLAKGCPLVLKSPANMARIGLLLEMFPGARFVHIHRHPHQIFRSTMHALNTTSPWWRVQTGFFDESWIIKSYAQVYDAYFRQRELIPAGNLFEVAYADLERDPLGEMERVYNALGLPDFGVVRDELTVYLDSIRGYAKNSYPELSVHTRQRVFRVWRRAFTEWGYPFH